MIETASDLRLFFEDSEIGIDAVVGATTIRGMIDNATQTLDFGIDAEEVMFTCLTADIDGVAEGSILTIDGVTLTVVDRIDDGTGISELQLSKDTPSQKLFEGNFTETAFFETNTFSVNVTFTDPALGTVTGILDTVTEEIDVGGATINAPLPILTAPTASLSNVVEGSILNYGSTRYVVKDRIDNGTGITDLELTEFDYLATVDNFFRPDGTGVYFRPDGESYYLRAS